MSPRGATLRHVEDGPAVLRALRKRTVAGNECLVVKATENEPRGFFTASRARRTPEGAQSQDVTLTAVTERQAQGAPRPTCLSTSQPKVRTPSRPGSN